jgi:hypothetical protein
MIKLAVNNKQFKKDMDNIVKYSFGYIDGIHAGKVEFFNSLGLNISEMLKKYIDSNARVNPQALNHIYEWYQVGSPNARLYDVKYTVSNLGLSFITNFKQSSTIKDGSRVPFYDKARIMEEGIPVVITPRNSDVLVFEKDGETVFTKNSVNVDNPGGDATTGSFEKVIDSFFTKYFTQAFLRSSGISQYLENPVLYKKNMTRGKKSGRSKGIDVGYRWIANAGLLNG